MFTYDFCGGSSYSHQTPAFLNFWNDTISSLDHTLDMQIFPLLEDLEDNDTIGLNMLVFIISIITYKEISA